jgi:hypothetical protein
MRFFAACRVCLASIFAMCCLVTAFAEVLQIEGKLSALDAAERTLTINDKTYEIAKKCSISINGKPAKLEDIPKDEAVVVTYDDKFEMVSAIAVGQPTWLFCDLSCVGFTLADSLKVLSDSEIQFSPNPSKDLALLVSSQKYGKCKLRFEVMQDAADTKAHAALAIAARAPNMEGEGFIERFPFGIEVKLMEGAFGKLVLPPNFDAEMVYGQERKGRDVPPLKTQTPVKNGWNTIEVAVQGNNDVVVTGNGVTLNALAKADSIEGHLVFMPPKSGCRIRNMTIEVDGETQPLSFGSIAVMPCGEAKPAAATSGLVGQFDVQWIEASGNSGSTRYEFKEDGSFLRAGAKGGSWKKAGDGVTMRFADPARGNASVQFGSPDSFEGTHTKSDGTKSTWKGSKVK